MDFTETEGAHLDIRPDHTEGTIVYRGYDPDSGDQVFEVSVSPAVAKEIAYRSTLATIALEDSAS